MPDVEPTDAIDGWPLTHDPPLIEFVFVMVCPIHTAVGPENDTGKGFTVKTVVEYAPQLSV